MKLPKNVLIIGTADFIRYHLKKARSPQNRTLTNHILAVNESHTILYIFPNKQTGATKTIKDRSGMQRGHFHTAIKFSIPTADLKAIGTVNRIQYSTDWWDGSLCKYEHVFAELPTLYADKYTRFVVMAIKTKAGKILTQEGIQG